MGSRRQTLSVIRTHTDADQRMWVSAAAYLKRPTCALLYQRCKTKFKSDLENKYVEMVTEMKLPCRQRDS